MAARAVTAVIGNGQFLDSAILDALSMLAKGKPMPLTRELCYGTLREYYSLRAIARAYLSRPLKTADADIEALMWIGLYQIRRLRMPVAVSVSETVAAASQLGKPWAKGLLNACLRRYVREPHVGEAALAENTDAGLDHPTWLLRRLREAYPNDWSAIVRENNRRPPMTLRTNTREISRDAYLEQLHAAGMTALACGAARDAVVLNEAVDVHQLPGFRDGQVSVQDAAAQLAADWLDVRPGQRVLDACAAPGGKAAHLLERHPQIAELTAVEIDQKRAARIRENFDRLRLTARIQVADATGLAGEAPEQRYDRILCDAPCSATGVIRRHPDIKIRRVPDDLPKLMATQRRLLDSLWPLLNTGGKLLYVTCSVLPDENELAVAEFLATHPDASASPLPDAVGRPAGAGRQILPGEPCGPEDTFGMDGFFYALLAKR